jgi:phenylacetate-coenzyme A ligase PaaK-like adenylate-forming protein
MTSGSTGKAYFILRSKKSYDIHLKRQIKIYESIKITPQDKFLNLLSYSISGAARIIDDALKKMGVCTIPAGSIKTKEHLNFVIKAIKELKPTVVESYVNEIFDVFAILGRRHSIKKCILTGEYLSKEFCRTISKIGNVQVYNNYGSMEFSGFAISEHPQDEYMRLFEDGLYIEVLREDGSISELGRGRIVITDLENTCMPFIRYILGDRVEIIKRGKRKYIKVLGRIEDFLLVDGEPFSKIEIINTLQKVLSHPNFFIVIDKNKETYKDRVLINILPQDRDKKDEIFEAIKREFPFVHLVDIRIYSGNIPKTSTGKYKHIIDLRKYA